MIKKIIFVGGTKPVKSRSDFIQGLIVTVYRAGFNFNPQYRQENVWPNELGKIVHCEEFLWSGGVLDTNLDKVANSLSEQLNREKSLRSLAIVTESIGAEIVFRALELLDVQSDISPKIICLSPVYNTRSLYQFPFTQIISNKDRFARVALYILWPFSAILKPKYDEDVISASIRHDEFVPETQIDRKHTLFEIVKDLIASNNKNTPV